MTQGITPLFYNMGLKYTLYILSFVLQTLLAIFFCATNFHGSYFTRKICIKKDGGAKVNKLISPPFHIKPTLNENIYH